MYGSEARAPKVSNPVPDWFTRRRNVRDVSQLLEEGADAAGIQKWDRRHDDSNDEHHHPLHRVGPKHAVHAAHHRVDAGNAENDGGTPLVRHAQHRIQQVGTAFGNARHVPDRGE